MIKKSKCLCCGEMYKPDKRNYWKQEYCSKPECRKESKKQAQNKWLKNANPNDLLSKKENVARVQEWRKKNPGYWKRKKKPDALRDLVNAQPTKKEEVRTSGGLKAFALQDLSESQLPLIVGVVAHFTGYTGDALQDHITPMLQKMIQRGTEILNPKLP